MTKKVLPFAKQVVPQEKYWDCGPAAAQVVLNSLGINVSEDDLIREIGTHTGGTDYVGLIEKALHRRAPAGKWRSVYLEQDPPTKAQAERLYADVRDSINAGFGVIMNWVSPPTNRPVARKGGTSPNYGNGWVWHYVACMGYDDEDGTLLIADSGFSPYVYWVSRWNAATLIPPKGYCYSTVKVPQPQPDPAPGQKPAFNTLHYPSAGKSPRTGRVTNFFIHTQEGDSTATGLALYCDGSHDVSYHYTLRDGVLCRLVDPKTHASWSVKEANGFSVNLCFAGSYAKWTREQWLARERDIEIAAYIIVRDCRELGIPLDVLEPPYGEMHRPGISDHRYVTKVLGIGTHWDVGDGFPWDRLKHHIDRFAGGEEEEDFMSALSAAEQREMLSLLRVLAHTRFPSRSPLRHLGEGPIDTVAGFDLNQDANLHILTVMELARAGVQSQIDLLREVAGADPAKYPDRQGDAQLARKLLAQLDSESTTGMWGGN